MDPGVTHSAESSIQMQVNALGFLAADCLFREIPAAQHLPTCLSPNDSVVDGSQLGLFMWDSGELI